MLGFACANNFALSLISLAYLLGSIPFGLVLTKLAGKGDVRKYGSGNIGATNVLRRAGKIVAFLTLVLDSGKGALAIYAASLFCKDYLFLMFVGMSSIIGHIFPVWLKFKGGKGVATSLAVILVLSPKVGLILCAVWLLTLSLFRISAVSALAAFVLAPVVGYFMTYDMRFVYTLSFISALVILRHHENIRRLAASKTR